jgi:iron complex transport system ATP-binding protein
MTAPLLSFRNVSFGYHPSQPILKDVDFDLRPGRIAAILGPNGAGKTTLLSLTLGWLTAWTGEIQLAGIPLRALPPRERGRLMALVPQSEHTPFDYTVLEYTLMGRAPHLPPLEMPSAADNEIALNALDQVGIAALAQRPVPQLSGGERQLLLLARALTQLAPEPSTLNVQPSHLLLLDEPTAHLDLHNKFRIIEIMRRLRDSGVTLLMTNHEPDVVLAVADDVLLMETGVPPQFGALDEVFTAAALSRIYKLPIRVIQVDGHKQVLWT